MKVKEGIRMAKRKGGDDTMVSRLRGNEKNVDVDDDESRMMRRK